MAGSPLQATLNGGYDAFVAKLNADGSALVYATYLGGSQSEEGQGLAVDATGHAYVTGWTTSPDFPVAGRPVQAHPRGGSDAFVVKLNAAGSALVYATYLGGSSGDSGKGIAVDAAGHAYVMGFAGTRPTSRWLAAPSRLIPVVVVTSLWSSSMRQAARWSMPPTSAVAGRLR